MVVILIILSLILVVQIMKITVKMNIINKNIIDFAFEIIITFIVFVGIFHQENLDYKIILMITIICIIYEIFSFLYIYINYIKNRKLSQLSIKNVIDNSNVGILILKENKQLLINNAMYKILKKMNIKDNYIENIEKQNIEKMDGNYVVKIDDKSYLFNINQNEIIVFEITEEYNLKKELDEQNKKIKSINEELINNINNLEELEKEKNLLKLKNKYHDLLGQNLSVLQQYLNKEKIDQENFDEIKFMIKKMFIDIEDTDDPKMNLDNLIKIHKKNGTNVNLVGKLPNDKNQATVFFEVIREAVTNAIKHAGSTKIDVKITETLEETSMIITNNGKKPNEFITENEGIKGMRRKVEEINGYFYVTTIPEFSVRVSINNY